MKARIISVIITILILALIPSTVLAEGSNTFMKRGDARCGNGNGGPSFSGEPNSAAHMLMICTVTFQDYDGTVLAKEKVVRNTAAAAPADPVRDGYTFIGWDCDFSLVTADMTVTAQYAKNTVAGHQKKPQENAGGGDDTEVLQDDSVPLSGPAALPWWGIAIVLSANVLWLLPLLIMLSRAKKLHSEL